MFEAINWNQIEDDKDLEVWNRLTGNFWLPEKIPLSNDIPSWGTLNQTEKDVFTNVFTNLTLLDTLQGTVGAVSLLPDALTQHEEAVYTNISFMERFAEGTEVLTADGWVGIEDIQPGTRVAQYHPETGAIDFANPTNIYPREWREEMYTIQGNNGNARQVVSAGHRVMYESKVKHLNSCKEWETKTATAEEMTEINLRTAFRRFRTAGCAVGTQQEMTPVDRLLVAVAADGSYAGSAKRCTGGKKDTLPVTFSFAKERKSKRLQELAQSAGWELRERSPHRGKRVFVLDVPLKYSEGYRKSLSDWWSLDDFSAARGRDFLLELGLWDGYTGKDAGYVTFYTAKKAESDFVVAMAALSGARARTTIRVDDRSDKFSDSYVTNIAFHRDTVSAQSMTITKTPGAWTHAIQVPSTYLVTRFGEATTPVITGNCVHAKSYSSIFSTLISTEEINETFRWAKENKQVQKKAEIINRYYVADDPEKKKIASVMLESFLFYSGFYYSLYWAAKGKLTNTADIIRLIIRDEAVHGYYIGYKFQRAYAAATLERQEELKTFTYDLLQELYDNEERFTAELYDSLGITSEVKTFLRYNANKALMNLGFEPLFPPDQTEVSPAIMAQLAPDANETHDFFSGSGSAYVIGDIVDTEDDDWDF